MSTDDGERIVGTGERSKIVSCTRWSELTDTIRFHAGLATAAALPTEFRMLNSSSPIMLGSNIGDEDRRCRQLLAVLEGSPGGGTPLVRECM